MDIYEIIQALNPESAQAIIARIEAQPQKDRLVLKDKLRQSLAREVGQESRLAFGSQESIDSLLGRDDYDFETDDPEHWAGGAFVDLVQKAAAEANGMTVDEYAAQTRSNHPFVPLTELSRQRKECRQHLDESEKPPTHLLNEYRKDGTHINEPSPSDFELR